MDNKDIIQRFREKFVAKIPGEHDVVASIDSNEGKETLVFWNAYTIESFLLTELQREKMEISERVLDYPDYAFCCGSCKSRILSKVVELIKKESI